MRSHTIPILLTLPLAGLFAGCSNEPIGTTSTAVAVPPQNVTTPPVVSVAPTKAISKAPKVVLRPTGKPITFREKVRSGEKFKWVTAAKSQVSGATSPLQLRIVQISTVVSTSKGVTSWKTIRNDEVESMGEHQWMQGEGPKKNHISLTTTDTHGNLLSSEGESPETPLSYKARPSKPVRVNESWRGYSLVNQKPYTDIYTLKAIETVQGRRFAVIGYQSGYFGENLHITHWIDLLSGIDYKTVTKGRFTNKEGQSVWMESTTTLVDEKGAPRWPL